MSVSNITEYALLSMEKWLSGRKLFALVVLLYFISQ